MDYCKKHPEVLDYLTCIADSRFKTTVVHRRIDERGFPQYFCEELPFDAKLFLKEELNTHGGLLGKYLNIHGMLSNVLAMAFPNEKITIDETLHCRYSFMLDACPEYIGGEDVEELLELILESLPKELSRTEKIKLYKEKVKTAFHIEKNKYPRWIQEAEWPMGKNNIPMRFLSQKQKKENSYETILHTEFLFEDTSTGEQRIVEQFL